MKFGKRLFIIISLLIASVAIIFSTANASSNGTYHYKWTVPYHSGWPFDDAHYVAEFFGDNYSTYDWKLKHYHYTSSQKSSCGDQWRLNRVSAYDSTRTSNMSNSSHSTHNHTSINFQFYDNVDSIYYVRKDKGTVVFEGSVTMKACNSTKTEYYSGSKWRDNSGSF